MKINPRDIDRFECTKFKATLFYGNNLGLIQLRIAKIHNAFPQSTAIKINYSDVLRDPDLLLNEMQTTGLFGDKKVIVISEVEGAMPKQLEKILSESHDAVIIMYGNEITAKDQVRKFFETSAEFAAVPCYLEEAGNLEVALKKSGIQVADQAAMQYISTNLSGDSVSLSAEIDKLTSFHKAGDKLSLEDVKAIISKSAQDTDADKYIASLIQGDLLSAEIELEKLILSDVKLSFIIRALSRYFTKLYLAHGLIADGISEAEAPSKLTPPIFFKNIPTFRLAIKRYSAPKTIEILEQLLGIEIKIKSNDTGLSKIIFEKELFNLFTS
jgi:DNA polymerase-3 subunit delta